MTSRENRTTEAKVEAYKACNQVFVGLLKEIRELSKKKADATLSKGQGNRFWKSENQKGEHKKNFLALSLRS